MKKNFKRWLALLLAVVVVATTCIYAPDHFLHATDGETEGAVEEEEPEVEEQELVVGGESEGEAEGEQSQEQDTTSQPDGESKPEETVEGTISEESCSEETTPETSEEGTEQDSEEVKEEEDTTENPSEEETETPVNENDMQEDTVAPVSETEDVQPDLSVSAPRMSAKGKPGDHREGKYPVYVYVQFKGIPKDVDKEVIDAALNEKFEGIEINDHDWYTIGKIPDVQISYPEVKKEGSEKELNKAIKAIDQVPINRFDKNSSINLSFVEWKELLGSDGATDYAGEAPSGKAAWHLNGTLDLADYFKEYLSRISKVKIDKVIKNLPADGSYSVGDTIQYEITVENMGTAVLNDVVITDIISVDESVREIGNGSVKGIKGLSLTDSGEYEFTIDKIECGDDCRASITYSYTVKPEDAGKTIVNKVGMKTTGIEVEGELPEVKAKVKTNILTVTARSKELPYIGKEQVITGFEYETKNGIEVTGADGNIYYVKNLSSEARGTDIGTYTNAIVDLTNAEVYDKDGKNVTSRFTVEAVPGILTIYGEVFYNENGGNGSFKDGNKYSLNDEITVLGGTGLSRDGAVFIGWSKEAYPLLTDSEQADEIKSSVISPGSSLQMGNQSITLYAVWAEDKNGPEGKPDGKEDYLEYRVTYKDSRVTEQAVTDDKLYAPGDNVVTRSDVFEGSSPDESMAVKLGCWKFKNENIGLGSTFLMPANDVVLTAQWKILTIDKKFAGDLNKKYSPEEDIPFTITVSNKGDVTLKDIIVEDYCENAVIENSNINTVTIEKLEAGEEKTFNVSCRSEGSNVDTGFTNIARAYTDGLEAKDSDTSANVEGIQRGLSVTKKISNGNNGEKIFGIGDIVEFEIVVENTGTVKLEGIVIEDSFKDAVVESDNVVARFFAHIVSEKRVSNISEPFDLDRGQKKKFKVSYKVQEADLFNPDFKNVVTATVGEGEDKITRVGESEVIPTVSAEPSCNITKTVLSKGSGENGMYKAGDTIEYKIVVENTGTTALKDITIQDTMEGAAHSIDWNSIKIASESDVKEGVVRGDKDEFLISEIPYQKKAIFTYKYTVTEEDIRTGSTIKNIATVLNIPGKEEDNSSTASVTLEEKEIAAEKRVVSKPQYNDSAYIVGEDVKYEVIIKNTGNVDLKDVVVSDRMWAWEADGTTATSLGGTGKAELDGGDSEIFNLEENEKKVLHYTYTVQPEDVGKQIFNVITVSDGPITVEEKSENVSIIAADPKLSLKKTILNPLAEGNMYKAGDEIRYQIEIINEGNIILKDVVIEDTMTGAAGKITATSATGVQSWKSEATEDGYIYTFTVKDDIGVGGSAFVTYTYIVTKEDEGKDLGNIAVAKDIPSASDPVNPDPIEVEKRELTVKKEVTSLPEEGDYNTDDLVEFVVTVTNTGNVTLNEITVKDVMYGTANNLQAVLRDGESEKIQSLEPGGKIELHYTYTVQEGDMRSSGIRNTVNVKAEDGTEGADETDQLPLRGQKPSYTISKTIISTGNAEGKYGVGDTIRYRIDVKNTGNVNLSAMTVKDIMVGASGEISNISGATWNEKTRQFITNSRIEVGATATITYDYVVQEADAGKTILNTAGPIFNSSSATAEVENKELTVQKTVTSTPKLSSGYVIGEEVTFKVVVTNTGDVTLSNIEVTDQMQNAAGQAVLADGESATIESLENGKSVTLHYTYTVQKEDIGKTDIFNVATAENGTATDNDRTEVISMDRFYNLIIHYVYEDGTTAAETVVQKLAYGEQFDPVVTPGIAGYTPDLAMVECGENGMTADMETTVVYRVTPVPQLSLTKTASEPDSHVYKLGEMIKYTITARNTGNVTLENIVVEDVLTGNSGNSACVIDILEPGASMDIPVTYTVADADVKAGGELLNVATAIGETRISLQGNKIEVTARAEKKVTVETQGPSLTIHKIADKVSGVKAGDVINYVVTVTNSGSVTLTKVDIMDELTGDAWLITGKGLSPGESQEYTTSYTVTEADILNGSVVNLAEAVGTDLDGNEITPVTPGRAVTYTEPINTNYTVTKRILNPQSEYIVDDSDTPIRYEITVASQANVTLHNVVVKDQLEGASGQVTFTELGKGTLNADNSVTIPELAPGETVTLNCEYIIRRADAGKNLVNTAIAAADPVVPADSENPTPVTPDEKRSSAAPASAEDIYTLTIHYRYASGREAAPDVVAQYLEGESFFHRSPSISGYRPNHAFIRSGNQGMPARDVEVTVTYRANASGSSSSGTATTDPTPNPGPGAAPGVTPDNTIPAAGGTTAPAAGTAPAAADGVAVPDNEVPMGAMVQLDEDGSVDIVPVADENVPLSAREFSRHMCCVLHLILMLASMIILASYTSRRKRCQARIFELTEQLRDAENRRR